jgi:hypothetical protein
MNSYSPSSLSYSDNCECSVVRLGRSYVLLAIILNMGALLGHKPFVSSIVANQVLAFLS